ncbi:unnamed protein product [Prorocentrum cordatum]|uniref:CSD domain-containing protein n=1 Tax=Prorocentrum cordatum TaxID=2364126 RepID=A0ABN9QWW4_9DINO|nr:unnamed protein product [Polarella glacialis]
MAEDGDRLRGVVRSFRGTWGFITSDEWEGDLFVGLKGNPHLQSLSPDDEVEFTVRQKSNSRAEAIDVTVCGREGQPLAEEITSGWVREFKGQWGFLNSDAFEGDMFVGLRSNPHLHGLRQGDQVDFEVHRACAGKVHRARGCAMLASRNPGLGQLVFPTGNPEEWWDFQDIEHPVGNLNAALLEAVSAQCPHLPRHSLDIVCFGTVHLQTDDVELEELFRNFSSICSRLASRAAQEWADFPVTGDFGVNIRAIGRAEKRLVVCAARLLLQHSGQDDAGHLEAAARAVERNAAATKALRQLMRPQFRGVEDGTVKSVEARRVQLVFLPETWGGALAGVLGLVRPGLLARFGYREDGPCGDLVALSATPLRPCAEPAVVRRVLENWWGPAASSPSEMFGREEAAAALGCSAGELRQLLDLLARCAGAEDREDDPAAERERAALRAAILARRLSRPPTARRVAKGGPTCVAATCCCSPPRRPRPARGCAPCRRWKCPRLLKKLSLMGSR